MREGFKKLMMCFLALALVVGVTVSMDSKVSAATAADLILLDETGAIIGEAYTAVDIDAASPNFIGATFDAGKSASDVAIILAKDPMGCYIVGYICPNTAAGKKMVNVVLPYPNDALKDSYKGLYGTAIEGIGSDVEKTLTFTGFAGSTTLKSVVVPSTVGKIATGSFANCTALESVTFSNLDNTGIRLRAFGAGVFEGCTSFKSFTIPCPNTEDKKITYTNNKYNKNGLFVGSSVETVSFENGLTEIGDYALLNATKVKTVNYPDTVKLFGQQAFKGATSLTSFVVKDSVVNIGSSAFENCTALASVTLSEKLYEIGASAFKKTALPTVTIPGSVQNIGTDAFAIDALKSAVFTQTKSGADKRIVIPANSMSNAKNLNSVSWPDTVTEIGAKAFYGTTSLTSVAGLDKLKAIGANVFEKGGLSGAVKLDAIETIGNNAFSECKAVDAITFGNNLTELGGAIIKSTAVTEVVIPSSLQKCNGTPFSESWIMENGKLVSSLTKATFLGDVIPAKLFSGAKTLKQITLNSGVTEVGDEAFTNCYNYRDNIAFDKVTKFGKNAFKGCYSLNKAIDISNATYFNDSCFEYDYNVFKKDSNALKEIYKYKDENETLNQIVFVGSFDKATKYVGASAFKCCINMNFPVEFTTSEEPVVIGNKAFSGTKLTSIELKNLKSVGNYAFSYNSDAKDTQEEYKYIAYTPLSVKSIKITGGEKVTIGDYAFYGAENATEFDISKADITSIGKFAFYNIHEIPTLTLPANLQTLQGGAFGGWSIKEITIPKTVKNSSLVENTRTTLQHGPFTICKNLEDIKLEEGMSAIPGCLFYHVQNQEDATLNITIPSSVTSVATGSVATFGGNVVKNVNLVFNNNKKAEDIAKTIKTQFVDSNKDVAVDVQINNTPEATDQVPVVEFGWSIYNGKSYWFENSVKQGTYSDPQGVLGDGTIRGREIYDPTSDGWYWLDSCYEGAKAVSKEVWMPYIYQGNDNWGDEEIAMNAANSGDMAAQVTKAIKEKSGKWVRYDANGKMYKGWYTVKGADIALYPDQAGNTYYYDEMTGLMAKGIVNIGGKTYEFDSITGALISER